MLLLVCFVHATQAFDEEEAIAKKSFAAFKHLTQNVSYQYTCGIYGDIEFGKKHGTTKAKVLANSETLLESEIMERTDLRIVETSSMWTDSNRLLILKKKDVKGYQINRDYIPWANDSDSSQYSLVYIWLNLGDCFVPTYGRAHSKSRCDASMDYRVRTKVVNISSDNYQSADCWKVEFDTIEAKPGTIITDFHISKQHGMVVAKRQKKMMHLPKGQSQGVLLNVDQLTEITYGPPTENGLPFPKSIKGWYVWPDGKREPMTDIEFTEYKRYTPTADELDFEKNFGIQLPALPPKPLAKPGAASKVGRWLLIALGVAAVATIAIAIARRRRRKITV